MSYVSVILRQNVKSLGKKDEIVKVKEGYASNFLFPNKLAVPYNSSTSGELSKEKADKEEKYLRELSEAKEKKAVLESKKVEIRAKSKDGKLFGAIVHKDISEAISSQLGVSVDKKKVIADNIKMLGLYNVEVKLHKDVIATVELEVISL
ncbi:MAG TPA: 50S ribosomal protein L9 [Fusobacteria bacterium]|nr:50S ribosomal protein L9 [Fusobacteriota bacterium]|tara:strand:- start:3413 stop:3862 length:450 start_codon:yes stop_codon:yes gene_type:complete